jgi:predicted phosphodiesterase
MISRVARISCVLALWLVASSALAQEVSPPSAKDSVQFLAIGDTGTGDSAQNRVAEQLARAHAVFPFTFAIMMGDNLYGSERTQDYQKKFEVPYKPLLDAKVEFYAALGNHDDPNQKLYKPFNMNGERFYTFKKGNVRFFALDSNYFDQTQADWLEKALAESKEDWKICFFHHPLYSSGARHGSEVDLRAQLEPLFLKHGVQVVFAGHEHFYERLKPQKGIYYFVNGGGAKLRGGDITKTSMTAVGFDTDRSYMLVEIAGDVLTFQTLSGAGKRVDSGSIRRPNAVEPTAASMATKNKT